MLSRGAAIYHQTGVITRELVLSLEPAITLHFLVLSLGELLPNVNRFAQRCITLVTQCVVPDI